jgi:probable rRNA maturation factor
MRVILDYTAEVTGTGLEHDFYARIAEETMKRLPAELCGTKVEVTLSAVLVSPERIQELNRTYRGKDAVTDILSFGEYADTDAFVKEEGKDIFLGELFFCYDFISRSAKEDEVSIKREMTYVFSHGILHLLGYDHSDEMFAIQDAVTSALNK